VILLIAIGVLAGVGFFVFDNLFRPDSAAAPTPTTMAVAQVTASPSPYPTPYITPTVAPNLPNHDASIFIPSVGIRAPVITTIIRDNTWDVTHLGTNVGYLQGTSWTTQPGNVVLSGHVEMNDGRQGVFATLDEVAVGDQVSISDRGRTYQYRVREMYYVQPDDLSVVYPTGEDILTLITCSDYNFVRNIYERRFVVVADRIS
jgi:sortase A